MKREQWTMIIDEWIMNNEQWSLSMHEMYNEHWSITTNDEQWTMNYEHRL